MKNPSVILILVVMQLISLSTSAQDCIKKMSWLMGTWITQEKGSAFVEEWIEVEGSMKCRSFEVTAGDTIMVETSSLSCVAGKAVFTYHPVLKDAGDKREPVNFVLVSDDNDTFIFENKAHDFPQRVVYQNMGKDGCHAWIEGEENGKVNRIDFNYKRVQ